uniref:Uncharacterized protein n=1 Tax=viral metagenome TaxID=1070528 RepID=A0A6M3L6V8_9ZZZZ
MTEELNTAAIADAVFTADIDDPNYTPPVDDDKKKTPKEEENKEEDYESSDEDDNKKKEESAKKEEPKPEDKVLALEKKLEDAQKEINRLGYTLRKDKKETKKEEPAFNKAQLLQLYKEHKDNPEVVFQIMEEMNNLGKADAKIAAEKSADITTKKKEMDQYLEKMYPDAKKEGTELYEGIQKAIEWAHLDGHPFAEHLAFGLLAVKNLPETIKKIKEEAKAEALKISEKDLEKKAEDARKKKIEESKPGNSGKSSETIKATSLTAEQMETLTRLVGGKPTKAQIVRYSKMAGNKTGSVKTED